MNMKKIYPLLIALMLFLTSCSLGGVNMGIFNENNESIANNTFEQIVNAIKNQDKTMLEALFSEKVRNEVINFDVDATDFLNFIQEEIISFDDATKAGIGIDGDIEHGKKRKEIQSSFCVETSEQKYYIAIRECTEDTFDRDNVGVKSIYIINANDWKEDYVYRGDGKWTLGINIVKESQA